VTERRLVLVDANVLINLAHVNRLDLLGALTDLELRAPSEVLSEIFNEPGKTLVTECRSRGHLGEMPFSNVAELTLFAELRVMMGMGEAACLALAVHHGALLASDEKKVFRREAEARLGPGRILNTPGLLLLGIRRGILTIEEADGLKRDLESKRFRMTFSSFREICRQESS
jgi:predicted nucleic acid-binding protein